MDDCIGTISAPTPAGDSLRSRRRVRLAGILRRLQGAPAAAPARSEARAMMMVTRDIGPYIRRMAERLGCWEERMAGRRALMRLEDRMLKDIGLSRAEAEGEYRKPFWR